MIFLPLCDKKRSRPGKHGGRLTPEDFKLEPPETGDWRIGVRPVLTDLWGERVVHAIITLPKSGNGGRRLSSKIHGVKFMFTQIL